MFVVYESSRQITVEGIKAIAIAKLIDWLKNLPPVFQPSGSKTKTNGILYARVCRALSGLPVFSRNSDWFIALLAPVVIGPSNYFGFWWFRQSFEKPAIVIITFFSQDPTAKIGEKCRIGPNVVIGANAVIQDGECK